MAVPYSIISDGDCFCLVGLHGDLAFEFFCIEHSSHRAQDGIDGTVFL